MLTVITSPSKLLTKRWLADGTIQAADKPYEVAVEETSVSSIEDLSRVLLGLEGKPRSAVVRGQWVGQEESERLMPGILEEDRKRKGRDVRGPRPGHTLRRGVLFKDVPLPWMMVDVDGFEPITGDPVDEPEVCVREFIAELPKEFHTAACHWQLSSSAGSAKAEGVLKAHLWFWLDRPLTNAQLQAWAGGRAGVDAAIYRDVQLHYTAGPVLDEGVQCPVKVRSGLIPGGALALVLPESAAEAPVRARVDRRAMVDPRGKAGWVGAFCSAYDPTQLVELCPDQFKDGRDKRSFTWVLSPSGAQDGVFITDDGMHLVNTSGSAPESGRALNLWDFIRVHQFGHLDTEETAWGPMHTWPSHQAMVDWVRGLGVPPPGPKGGGEPVEEGGSTDAGETSGGSLLPAPAAAPSSSARRAEACRLIEAAGTVEELEKSVAPVLAGWAGVGDAEREQMAVEIRARSIVLGGARLPIGVVRRWLRPRGGGLAGGVTWVHLSAEGTPKPTVDNLEALMKALGVSCRYNAMTKRRELGWPGFGWSKDNEGNAGLGLLVSEMEVVDMPTRNVRSQMYTIADRNIYHPVRDWIESAGWDGVDRIEAWLDTIESDASLKRRLMLAWAGAAVAAVFADQPKAAQGLLVLQGPQGLGKTRWAQSLCPVEEAVATGETLDPRNKDSVIKCIRHWIVELGELDATFRRADIAALKAFATQAYDEVRMPYAEEVSVMPRRTVYLATVNEEEMLQDKTGNRRFWVLPVRGLRVDHGIDMQQFWAQVRVEWEAGRIQTWLDGDELAALEKHNESFMATDAVAEKIASEFAWRDPDPVWQWMTVTAALEMLGWSKPARQELNWAGAAIRKLNGGKKKTVDGIRMLLVPVKRPPE